MYYDNIFDCIFLSVRKRTKTNEKRTKTNENERKRTKNERKTNENNLKIFNDYNIYNEILL